MNEQPPVIMGFIVALGLTFIVIYYFFEGMENASKDRHDTTITLGYITEEVPTYDKTFYDECRNSLVSIGYKKSHANTMTKQVFSKFIPNDITSFLVEAIKLK
jgi:hypothetical protein